MHLNKIISILIASLLIAALAGCGSGGGIASSNGGNSNRGTGALSWSAPTTNTDGSALTDLAGYKFYYGTSSGHYTGSIDIADKNATSMPIATLASAVPSSGTYYVALTAYDNSGIESDYSNETILSL